MKEFKMNLQAMSEEIHADCVAAGWWKGYKRKADRAQLATVLAITELVEAVEGDRKSLKDDHLPQYDMRAVELADTVIRLLDLAGALEATFAPVQITKMLIERRKFKYKTFPEQIGELMRDLLRWTAGDRAAIMDTILGTFALAHKYDYDLQPIIEGKLAYNKTRADHKEANRAKEGGKAY